MGRDESPLRDRVIFVEGAPRSGTTWLVTLLNTHPEIAGMQVESHLFDYGVDRLFDNWEYRHPTIHGLHGYVDRDELVDLARDLCDGVLTAMREHVRRDTSPTFVIEKTPHGARADGLDLERKLECYPDAWYVHIVRDRDAVTKSLMRAPFMRERSEAHCAAVWDRSVGTIRRVLGDAPRYRELAYEELRADPAAACSGIFAWLGVGADEPMLETVRALSRERFSELGVAAPQAGASVADQVRGALRSARARVQPVKTPPPEGARLAFELVRALRRGDRAGVDAVTHPALEYVRRGHDGDDLRDGDAGREALMSLAERSFARRFAGDWWAGSGGDGEFWTSAPGKPFWALFFSGIAADATRTDLAVGLFMEDGLIRRVVVMAASPESGRPLITPSKTESTSP